MKEKKNRYDGISKEEIREKLKSGVEVQNEEERRAVLNAVGVRIYNEGDNGIVKIMYMLIFLLMLRLIWFLVTGL